MEPWYRNIEVLLLKDPALAELVLRCSDPEELSFGRAKNGEPIAKRAGICLHSSYDPSREAAEWLKTIDRDPSAPLSVLGLGLGYHIKALAEAGFRGAFIEPDPAMFRMALKHLDLTGVLEQFEPIVGVPLDKLRRSRRDLLAGETIAHPASMRTSPEYIEELAGYARSLGLVRKGGLKILLVNPIYGGSLPAARHCATALKQLGHEVGVFSAESFASGMGFADRFSRPVHRKNFLGGMVSFLSQGVEMMAREFEPDLVLALAQAPLQQPELGHLEQMGIPTAFWFVEDYRVLPYWREVAPGYSHFFAIQQGDFPAELARNGVRRQSYLPTSAAPDIHLPLELSEADRLEFGSPLSFVGAGYYNRQRFFRGLTNYPFKIWGSDWPLDLPLLPFIQRNAARIDTETCVKIFNASDINLNLHSSSHHEGVDPSGDFVNPRTFEIACCNAFQLVDRRGLMPGLFADDEMETFADMTELRDKIGHFLARPESRQATAEKSRNRVLGEHTYLARMEELLAIMIGEFPICAEKQRQRLDRREAFLTEMSGLDGIDSILSRIPPGKAVGLPDIYRSIEISQGELSRTEKIFLMLKNIEVAQEVAG
ncbi:MAG: glycosyltransferase [Desulfobacteraceae bacterium]|nr:glycosyltransferase [Desulfobacteraceae bacterium]